MESIENKILDICRNYHHYLMAFKNVRGVGLGLKEINNTKTLEPCIHVLVEEKVNKNFLSTNNIVPKSYMGINTDVIKIGKINAFLGGPITKRFRPLQGGGSITAEHGSENGTMGK